MSSERNAQDQVLLNDFRAQWAALGPALREAFARVGASGRLVLGPEVAAFERDLARYVGLPYCVGVGNGMDALEIALRVHGIGAGATVITTPLTAFATTLAIVRAGARPLFVDVDSSGLIDLDAVERVLAQRGGVRAIVPVHLFGHAVDVARLESLRREYGVVVVEDCAQAIGARSAGRVVGSASELSATSFYPTKNLGAMGDGGAIFAKTEALAARAASLRDYGQSARYVHDQLGMNSRLDEVQAALLRTALLPDLDAATERRRAIAARYQAEIRSSAIELVPQPEHSESVWHLFPVLVRGDRERFRAHLMSRGVQSAVHYPTLTCDQRALSGLDFVCDSALSVARDFAQREVSLPIHRYLTDAHVTRVIEACNSFE
jgi:dTDP-3-amino-3,4,6-trideoxy-alpha-D-glucose transaminase